MATGRMTFFAILVGLILSAGAAAEQPDRAGSARYDDHQVVRVELRSARDMQTLFAAGAISWSCRVGPGAPDFVVSPEQRDLLTAAGIQFQVLIDDVQALIDEERAANEAARQGGVAGDPATWFTAYRENAEVTAYIDDLVALRPDIAEKVIVGSTHEGRTIYGVRIASPLSHTDDRPAILLNGCQHAREWISVMVPMYIADRFVRDFEDDPQITSFLEQLEFIIVPIVNPDGYAFSYHPTGNRMWRKNRRANPNGSFGVDLNRNWDVDWNGPYSTSINPSSDLYVGPSAFSEPETQAMRDLIEANPHIVAHIDFHNFSQLVLQPLGFTTQPPKDFDMLDALGAAMSDAIESVHGVPHPNGIPGDLLYFASGLFQDWTYDAQGILGYTIEMRPATFNPGFLLPPDQIIPTSEENFAGVLAMAQFVIDEFVVQPQPCFGDLTGNGVVNVFDLLEVLAAWGPCPPPEAPCPADLNADGFVNVFDVLELLAAWGECAP